jgi:GT2 family glycosyltransferase
MSQVSVVVVNHNSGQMLQRSLNSVARTDYENFETVLEDIGPTDVILECSKKPEKNSLNLSILENNASLGATAPKNIGALSSQT